MNGVLIRILIACSIILFACNNHNEETSKLVVLSGTNRDDLIQIQKDNIFNNDSMPQANLYIYKCFDETDNVLVSHRRLKINKYDLEGGNFFLSLGGYALKSPFYGSGNIFIDIDKKNTIKTEMKYDSDKINDVLEFESIKKNCRTKAIYLSDSISEVVQNLHGFINIEFYKDEVGQKKDFNFCISFTLPVPPR